MALADTAKLVATLELQDKFSKNAALFDRTVLGLDRRTTTLGRVGGEVGRGLGAAANNLKLIGVVAAGVIGSNVAAGIATLQRLETVTVATNAVLASTKGVAGQTAESVRNLAEKYESLNATIDDKVIQSGENLLLTFTNINKEAFEPALVAALDLNTALGGGEEGLQGTIIQVGKALQDPIRGLTNLRRVGVNFSETQKTQIKQLVAQNDLYGAQRVILDELATEFGGRFAAEAGTAAEKTAKFKDAIEDAQAALATALLPVIGKVRDRLTTFLSDPKILAGIESFGGELATGFDKAVQFAGKIPWETIGTSLQLAGQGAKTVLDAFLGLPDWIQTAVITGWGLNKLTGGALGNIGGLAVKMVFERGASPANPLWVQMATGGGPGGPTPVPTRSGFGEFLSGALKLSIIGGVELALAEWLAANVTSKVNPTGFGFEQVAGASGEFGSRTQVEQFAAGLSEELGIPLDEVKQGIVDAVNTQGLTFDQAVDQLRGTVEDQTPKIVSQFERSRATSDQLKALMAANTEQTRLTAQRTSDIARYGQAALGPLGNIAGKDFSTKVNVNVTANTSISINDVIRSYSNNISAGAYGSGGGGAINANLL